MFLGVSDQRRQVSFLFWLSIKICWTFSPHTLLEVFWNQVVNVRPLNSTKSETKSLNGQFCSFKITKILFKIKHHTHKNKHIFYICAQLLKCLTSLVEVCSFTALPIQTEVAPTYFSLHHLQIIKSLICLSWLSWQKCIKVCWRYIAMRINYLFSFSPSSDSLSWRRNDCFNFKSLIAKKQRVLYKKCKKVHINIRKVCTVVDCSSCSCFHTYSPRLNKLCQSVWKFSLQKSRR